MNFFTNNMRIFYALLTRDIKILRKDLHNKLIDGMILVLTTVLMFGKLFPLFGMPKTLIAPIFLGNSLVFLTISFGYSYALRFVYDLKFGRFIDYQMTLPLSKVWLFLYFLVSFIIEACVTTLPLVTFGTILLSEHFGTTTGNWIIFLCVYFLTLIFWGLFFISSAFAYNFGWFRNNMWARRIMPMFCLSPSMFTFKHVSNVSPFISNLFFFNPMTYVVEGLRSSLLGGTHYLNVALCVGGILFFIPLLCLQLKRGIYKQLDPV